MDRFSLWRDSEKAALRISVETRHNSGQDSPVRWTLDLASSIRPSLEAKPDGSLRVTWGTLSSQDSSLSC